MDFADLSVPERLVWQAFTRGTWVDLREGDPIADGLAAAPQWGPERIIRAEVIRALLGARDVEPRFVPGVRLRGALAGRPREPEWRAQYTGILPGWFGTYLSLESAATAIRTLETQFVPGPFQTEDYARAVTRLGHQTAPAEEIDRRAGLRLRRRELFLTGPAPGRRALHRGRRPAQRRGTGPGGDGTLHPAGRPPDMTRKAVR